LQQIENFTATLRIRNYPSQSKTFDIYKEAKAWLENSKPKTNIKPLFVIIFFAYCCFKGVPSAIR